MRADVGKLLHDVIGLDVETIAPSVVPYAVKQRMAACGVPDVAAYWNLVTGSREELQELINAVIVPETWFFRDREAFGAMTRHARTHALPGRPVRLLSLPCSTGEEPYSMAMAMLDAGFVASEFAIDGIDVSTRNVAEATRAIYGRNSFRGADIRFRDHYFEAVDGGYRPVPAVMNQVRFMVGNLFNLGIAGEAEAYDVIFCRNLLIYFDRELQHRALHRLHRMLAPNGILLVGPAEASLPALCGFASARAPRAFAFHKREPSLPDTPGAGKTTAPSRKHAPARLVPSRMKSRREPARIPSPVAELPPDTIRRVLDDPEQISLAAIETCANAGRYEEAKKAAHRHIATFGPCSGAFYLLALAHDADHAEAEAIENYRKALYLAPRHRESLAHLALLLERKGETAEARVLTARLRRLETRSDD